MDAIRLEAGLCDTCRFRRIVTGARSTFTLCERSFADPRYRRYPPLPVRQCEGYVPQGAVAVPAEKTGKTQ